MGNVYSVPTTGSKSITFIPYPEASLSRDDYGFLISLGFKYKISKGINLVLDLRALSGLRDITLNKSQAPIVLQDFQALFGVRMNL